MGQKTNYVKFSVTGLIVLIALFIVGCGNDFLEFGYLVNFPFKQVKRYDFKDPYSNFYDFVRIIYISDKGLEDMVTTTDVMISSQSNEYPYAKELKMEKYVQWMKQFKASEAYQKAKDYDKVLVHYWMGDYSIESEQLVLLAADKQPPVFKQRIYPNETDDDLDRAGFGFTDGYKSLKPIYERVDLLLFKKGTERIVSFNLDYQLVMSYYRNKPIQSYHINEGITFNREVADE